MSAVYLLIMGALAALCIILAKGGKSKSEGLKEVSVTSDARVIEVYDMDEATLMKAIDDFIGMYSDDGDVERPKVSHEGKPFRLEFSDATDYISICYWVNNLVYSDEEKKGRFAVRGWYPFGEVTLNDAKQPFSNQTVMIYVDRDDKDYDNVSFVTPDGKHYLQSFGSDLKPLDSGEVMYQLPS